MSVDTVTLPFAPEAMCGTPLQPSRNCYYSAHRVIGAAATASHSMTRCAPLRGFVGHWILAFHTSVGHALVFPLAWNARPTQDLLCDYFAL